MYYDIKVGSVTNAQRGLRILKQNAVRSSVIRIFKPPGVEGCGYALRVMSQDKNRATELLRKNGVRIIGDDR